MGAVSPSRRSRGDVAVVGSGPNGLAAAVTLARAGLAVDVLEANAWPGGGAATRELTEPGFHHDLASAVHPMAVHSPFFRAFGLEQRVSFAFPQTSFAHALSPRDVVRAHRLLAATAVELAADGRAYARLLDPVVRHIGGVADLATGPLLRVPPSLSSAWALAARTLEQGSPAWGVRFGEERAPALLTGAAAHTTGRHPRPAMAAAGLVLAALAHARGWPLPRGGSGAIAEALIEDLVAFGGRLRLGERVDDLPALLASYRTVVLNLSAREVLRIERGALPRPTAVASRGCDPGAVSARSTTRSKDLCRGVTRGWPTFRRCTWAGLAPTSPLPRTSWHAAVCRSARTSCSSSRPSSTARAHREAGRCSGPTRTSPSAAPWTEPTPSRPRSRSTLPDFAIVCSRATARRPAGWASSAPTSREGTSPPARSPWASCCGGLLRGARRGARRNAASTWHPGRPPGPSVHGMAGWWAARTALADQYGLGTPDLAPVPRAVER